MLLRSLLFPAFWAPAVLAACNADNCLRAIRGKEPAGASFCSAITSAPVAEETAWISTYSRACQGQVSRASSACSCFMATYVPEPTETAAVEVSDCHRDNCFRGLLRADGAYAFCETYTTAIVTQTQNLPSFASACSRVPSAVSSGCSCIMSEMQPTATRAASVTSSSSSSSTIPSSTSVVPACTPAPQLVGVSENAFNPERTTFSIKLSCGEWNSTGYAVFQQRADDSDPFGKLVEGTSSSGSVIQVPGIQSGYMKLAVVGFDLSGTPILKEFSHQVQVPDGGGAGRLLRHAVQRLLPHHCPERPGRPCLRVPEHERAGSRRL